MSPPPSPPISAAVRELREADTRLLTIFDSLGNFKWLNPKFFFQKEKAKKGLKNVQSTLKCIALTRARKSEKL